MLNFIFYMTLGSSGIPLFFINYKRFINFRTNRFYSFFVMLLMARFLTDLSVFVLEKTIHNSLPTFHFSGPVQFILILELFYLVGRFKLKKSFFIVIALVFSALDLFITSNLFDSNVLSALYHNLAIIFIGFRIFLSHEGTKFERLILESITIYYAVLIFYIYFFDETTYSKELMDYIMVFVCSVILVLNGIFTYSLCLNHKN